MSLLNITPADYRIGITLLSGGLDSTTCAYHMANAKPGYNERHAVSIDYGQRHNAELKAAARVVQALGACLDVLNDRGHRRSGFR